MVFAFRNYSITSSTIFTAVFILLLVVVTIAYVWIPGGALTVEHNESVTDTYRTNSTIACSQQFGNLPVVIPRFLPDSNEVELYNEDSDFSNNYHQVFSTFKYQVHGTELEAMTAVQMALKMKDSMKFEKATRLFEHALVLQPLHPEVLNHYAEFLEENKNDVITADHLYVKVLILCPNHSRALVNRTRTMPLVEAMDRKELERIDRKRIDLVTLSHNQSAMKRVRKEVYFLHIHHTLALEGNTMSLSETRAVVETKTAIPGKSIMEHNEILGLESALRYMNKTLVNISERLTVFDILEIHKRVLGHVDPLSAGTFRRSQVFVGEYVPPPASEVEYLMEQFVEWLQSDNMQLLHPVKRAAVVHYRLAHIHPFVDGNGRTARLLMNLILMRAGYPPVIIRKQDRSVYYSTLQMANEGDIRPFIRFIAHCTECTLDVFLNAHEYDAPCFRALEPRTTNFSDAISL
ncbi:Adenosine monophosphate-protein transferase Fic [Araneus ventricosus]|uniref:Protein adenylyltransferase Fic n=1 Tax=Araneus ventricosus TaxID=182803 RepID=A0A4Y2NFN1_ARAVE|nr:Adenosine monophosphate-protein transferase Fic [Araneus ventricosus]